MKCSDLIRELREAGWYAHRQRGSHVIMRHPTKKGMLVVPNHGSDELGKGLEKKIRKQAGLK